MLKDFLLDLINDPAKMEKFRKNTDEFVGQSNLSDEEKSALKAGDPHKLQELVSGEFHAMGPGGPPLPPLIIVWPKPPPNPNGVPKPPLPPPEPPPSPPIPPEPPPPNGNGGGSKE